MNRQPESATPIPQYEALQFRGRLYLRTPVAWRDGLELQALLMRLRDAEETGNLPELMEKASRYIRAHLLPCSRLERVLRPVLPNPWRSATAEEIGVCLGMILRGAHVQRPFQLSEAE